MAITDAHGLPIAIRTTGANRHEVKLVEETLEYICTENPQRLIGDRAYDSDKLRAEMKLKAIDIIVPHRKNRTRPPTQDGRSLRRYKKRWKVERLFAWIHNYRRCVVRYDYYNMNFEGFVLLASMMIYLKKYF